MRAVTFDYETRRVVAAQDKDGNWWHVEGHCLRCGKCCPPDCSALAHETVDDKPQAVCTSQWSKPWQCMVWPHNPDEALLDGCGYSWERD